MSDHKRKPRSSTAIGVLAILSLIAWGHAASAQSGAKEQPVYYYVPSIAPGSLLVYAGNQFMQWKGDLFAGALALTHLNHIELDPVGRVVREHRWLAELGERIRAVVEAPDGALIVSTDSGKILMLSAR